MTPLYAYSLLPVLSVAVLLCTSLLLYGREMVGLTLYCAAIAVWSASLLLLAFPNVMQFATHLAQSGTFVSAAFLHVVYDFTRQRHYTLVWLAYGVAVGITGMGVVWPGLLYAPASLSAGPAFWPAMALAIGAALVPLWHIARAYGDADRPAKRQLRLLGVSGGLCFLGAWLNAVALSHGLVVPYFMLMVLASLLLLTGLVGHLQQAAGRRLLERSLLYAAMTALLSAGFLFGVLTLMHRQAEPLVQQYQLGAWFLLFMAALAVEPLRLSLQQCLSRWVLTTHTDSQQLAAALAQQEQRADQAERLATLGTFVSAVAHEIRNPLGVMTANLHLLAQTGADPTVCAVVREQVQRVSTFLEDLLAYGRPRPLDLRLIDLAATIHLACSTVIQVLPEEAEGVQWLGMNALEPVLLEADQGQLLQVFAILLHNTVQALHDCTFRQCQVTLVTTSSKVCIHVDDSGPGIPEALRARLFEPFVTGRKREGPRSGTGLGLAIAKGIVERHHGTLCAGTSALGGARFEVCLPTVQQLVWSPNEGT